MPGEFTIDDRSSESVAARSLAFELLAVFIGSSSHPEGKPRDEFVGQAFSERLNGKTEAEIIHLIIAFAYIGSVLAELAAVQDEDGAEVEHGTVLDLLRITQDVIEVDAPTD